MEEYERAAAELVAVIDALTDEEFELVRDRETGDDDCRSIQTVAVHVVRAGYGYAVLLRRAWGIEDRPPWPRTLARRDVYERIAEMLDYTRDTLDGRWQISEGEAAELRIEAPWGPVYDLEQLLEHAIVHVLRHRRQIERFLAVGRTAG